ncbi:MAG: hypothetical protein JST86_04435 [Bacteroidetes bacterium]|nr:hypothetical protein [Bacteroidota bacterium]
MRAVLFTIFILFYNFSVTAQVVTTSNHQLTFKANLSCTAVKDQFLSSTCWSFAGNSFFESELLKQRNMQVDISEMYTARCAWIQKIPLHLASKGLNYLTPGGQFHNIQWVIKNYGLMPESAYSGKVNGTLNHNHGDLDTLLTHFVERLVKQHKTKPVASDWKYINALLDHYLGKVPQYFFVEGKKYTPQTYASKYLKINANDYVEIMSYTHHPYYQAAVFENKYNFTSSKYMNVPFADFVAITDSALLNGYTVLWNGDVTDEHFKFEQGIATLPGHYDNIVQSRQQAFADSSSYMDHLMHIVGLLTDESGHRWYYLKNSWGTGNALQGYMLMDENYFAIKTAAIVVNKKAIPTAIRKKMNL